jgi:hypothetical protein
MDSVLGMPLAGAGGRAGQSAELWTDQQLADKVLEEGWVDGESMAAAAGAVRADSPALYNTVLKMGRQRAADFVAWVWQMNGGQSAPTVDRLRKLQEHAQTSQCTCGGQWCMAAAQILNLQGVNSIDFRNAVLRALRFGRCKQVNVLIVGEPDSGKSYLLKPLAKMFATFEARGQRERFPLQGLHDAEICVLQDVRYESFGLCWDDWLRWGEGDTVMVNLPRSTPGAKSSAYKGTAPLFATMADMFSFPLTEARRSMRCVERENVQFRSRWCIFNFRQGIPKAQRNITLSPCCRCAAAWYLETKAEFDRMYP